MTNHNGQMTNDKIGKAYLVGAGPGRPDLITVRGLTLLRRAEVVLYDRLIPQELLDEVRPDAELIFVGKKTNRHVKTQTQINQLLVEQVQAGKMVVRLKGGDPLVFGRGGEEVLALAQANLPYEIVPGVSSILAGPAYAGIPVTHRGMVTSFAVATGHEDPTKPESNTDWAALARIPTLILLMAVKRIAIICSELIQAGRDPDSPVAIISWATTDRQQVFQSTLADLPEMVERDHIETPALVLMGDVVNLRDTLAWFQPDGHAEGFVPIESALKLIANTDK